jgi:microcin C transport system ATP-binding protein
MSGPADESTAGAATPGAARPAAALRWGSPLGPPPAPAPPPVPAPAPPGPEPLLAVRDLAVDFGDGAARVRAVRGVSWSLAAGETLALVGESGSGKSVTALSVLQLLPYPRASHPSGSIRFRGEELLGADERRLRAVRGGGIGMIFQEPMTSLNPLHHVGKQLGEVLTIHQGLRGAQARARSLELLEQVRLPDPQRRLRQYPHELSGGQRQRVMIAMALANTPALLIADEPTTALDVTVQAQILDLLKELQRALGMALLLISHDLNVVRRMADRICVMRNGEIVEAAGTETLFRAPTHPYTRALIDAEPQGRPAPAPADAAPLLEVHDLRVHFPIRSGLLGRVHTWVRAVDGVSLRVAPGRTLGIVGESGSGKSTLIAAILRLQTLAAGRIVFRGEDITAWRGARLRRLRSAMQIVFQDPFSSLSPRLSVEQIVAEGLDVHAPTLSGEVRETRIAAALADVGLDAALAGRYPHELSGGQRQRVALARALVLRPALIVLDEPTSALDRSVQAQLVALLRDLQARHRLAYLFVSHDLKVVRVLAHDVLVLKDGVVVEQGSADAVFERPTHPYTRGLLAAAG